MLNRKYIRSPLFYVGDKYKIINNLISLFPKKINRFFEPFVGGGSVFLNVNANAYYLNDINEYVIKTHKMLVGYSKNPNKFFTKCLEYYNLSMSFMKDVIPKELKIKYKKTYYAHYNKKGYNQMRKDFNNEINKDIIKLYLLIIYGFNRTIRFNSKGEFNLPVGNVDFNTNVVNALNNYFRVVKEKKLYFNNLDYINFLQKFDFNEDDFIYFDPPYLITNSEYNKLWNRNNEKEMINILDNLNKKI